MAYEATCPYFVVGGTLTGNAASYVERRADTELLAALQAGEYCYVLDTRQVGKSSLIVRAAQRLHAAGRLTTFLDLSTFGDAPTEEQWYGKLLADLVRALDMEDEADAFWEANTRYSGGQRWFLAMRDLVLPALRAPLIVFVDEIEAVRKLPFTSDGFFAMIRALYNLRATEPASERLTFCLAGVATPADLIRDAHTTPFNIGRRIALRDFNPNEMNPLAEGLCGSLDQQREQIQSIGRWTSGHPYLTQRFCQAVAEQRRPLTRQEIDALCGDVFLHKQAQSEEANLHFVRRQLLDDSEPTDLLMRYYGLLSGKRIEVGSVDTLTDRLLLSGIAVIDPDQETPCLKVRNCIYARVFDRRWVRANLPDAEHRRQRQALQLGYLRASVIWAALAASLLFALARQYEVSRQQAHIDRLDSTLNITTGELNRKRAEAKQADVQLRKGREEIASQQKEQQRLKEKNDAQSLRLRKTEKDQLKAYARIREAEHNAITIESKSKAREEDSESRRQSDLALMGSGISGQEFEALEHGLNAITSASKRDRTPTAEAVQGLAQAAAAGVYRLLRLNAEFRLETATFSPDGKYVVTAGWSRDLIIWDTDKGEIRARVPVLVGGVSPPKVWAVDFSNDGRYLAAIGNDRNVHIWEFATLFAPNPHPLWLLPCGNQQVSKAAACFSYSGHYLAASGHDNGSYNALIWKMPPGASVSSPTQIAVLKHAGEIESLDFNDKKAGSEERFVAVAGNGNPSVRIFDFLSREEVYPSDPLKASTTVPAKVGNAHHALFACWNDSLYSAGDDGTIQAWGWNKALGDHPAAEGLYKTYLGHEGTVSSLAVCGDGVLMASTGLKDYRVNIWYREYSAHPLYTLTSHTAEVTSVRFSNDYHHLVTASYDKTAEIWLLASPLYCGAASSLNFLAMAPDGSTIAAPSAVGGSAGRALLWQTEWKGIGKNDADRWPWNIIGQTTETQFPGSVYHAAYSPNGKQLATGGEHGDIRIWPLLAKGRMAGPYVPLKGQTDDKVNCVAFSPDGGSLLSASDNHIASLWDLRTGKGKPIFWHPDKVYSCAFSPDSKQVLTGCADGVTRLFDLAGHLLRTMQLPDPRGWAAQNYPWSVTFSPNGKWLLTGDSDGSAYLWDRESGKRLATLPYQHGQVFSAQFSRDGGRVITVGNGGYAEIWNISEALEANQKGKPAIPWFSVRSNSAPLYGGQFSPDGQYIFVAGKDCMARRYPATIAALVREAQDIRRLGGQPVPMP
ncbi:MAG: hypothetical protein JWL77_3995 [Chthonomonadaceae bacterium]|nr:hypothetical protein [Chthonomonadaceae bacterium]